MDWTWPTWNYVEHTERVKQGADVLDDGVPRRPDADATVVAWRA